MSIRQTPSLKSALHPIEASVLHARREKVFLIFAGIFLATLALLNVLGISRFIVLFSIDPATHGWQIHWGHWHQSASGLDFALAVGVLPYPITFFCTDVISEFYGRRRANWVVFVGLLVNLWVILILWVGGVLPYVPQMDPQTGLPPLNHLAVDAGGHLIDNDSFAFYRIRARDLWRCHGVDDRLSGCAVLRRLRLSFLETSHSRTPFVAAEQRFHDG